MKNDKRNIGRDPHIAPGVYYIQQELCARIDGDRIIVEKKESEDEMIRKWLINYFNDYYDRSGDTFCEMQITRILAYLEKQKNAFENGRQFGIMQEQARQELEWTDEKQKEQKPIIQNVELNDAVYDYVRDHFIAGADFTPEYIKKLMENAFFAGVDYYLLQQEFEACEPDTNVEKVIEDVIRVYGKTQGEWVGGYDVDTLIVNLRRAFNKKEQKPTESSNEDVIQKAYKEGINDGIALVKKQPEDYGLQKPAEYGDDVVEEAEEYTSKVDCDEYGVAVTEAYIAGVLSERNRKPVEWSPTKEQMVALSWAANSMLDNDFPSAGDIKASLRSLYNNLQLKSIKPTEWGEEDGKHLNWVIEHFNQSGELYHDLIAWFKSLPERFNLPSKQEWSEDDKEMLMRCVAAIPVQGDEILPTSYLNKLRNWLESIPERFNLQLKQEWSEEDEMMIRFYENDYDNNLGNMPMCDVIENRIKFKYWLLNKLKSLRPSWKPSEKQMQYLLAVINDPNNAGAESCHLTLGSLYNDLKKLM